MSRRPLRWLKVSCRNRCRYCCPFRYRCCYRPTWNRPCQPHFPRYYYPRCLRSGQSPFLFYPLDLNRPNLSGVLLAPVMDFPASSGIFGIEIISPSNTIVAQSICPAEEIDESVPTQFSFSPIPDSDRGRFWLRVLAREVDIPIRILEWHKFSMFGFGRLQRRAFCGFVFGKAA